LRLVSNTMSEIRMYMNTVDKQGWGGIRWQLVRVRAVVAVAVSGRDAGSGGSGGGTKTDD
jgi:hypothetical protein